MAVSKSFKVMLPPLVERSGFCFDSTSEAANVVIADIQAEGARRLMFVDLNLVADRSYAQQLFAALIPLQVQWYGLATASLCDDLPLLDLVEEGNLGLIRAVEKFDPERGCAAGRGYMVSQAHELWWSPKDPEQGLDRLHRRLAVLGDRLVLQGQQGPA